MCSRPIDWRNGSRHIRREPGVRIGGRDGKVRRFFDETTKCLLNILSPIASTAAEKSPVSCGSSSSLTSRPKTYRHQSSSGAAPRSGDLRTGEVATTHRIEANATALQEKVAVELSCGIGEPPAPWSVSRPEPDHHRLRQRHVVSQYAPAQCGGFPTRLPARRQHRPLQRMASQSRIVQSPCGKLMKVVSTLP